MNASRNWMPLYIGDYLRDTVHLTAEEHGAYLLLIMAYWNNGGPLPDDDIALAQIARVSRQKWAAMRGCLKGFFRVAKGRLVHRRIDEELSRASDKSQKRRNAANARWATEKDDANAYANADTDTDANAYANDHAKGMTTRARATPSHKRNTITDRPEPAPARAREAKHETTLCETAQVGFGDELGSAGRSDFDKSNLNGSAGRSAGNGATIPDDWMEKTVSVLEAAQFHPARAEAQAAAFDQVRQWLAGGIDVELEILPIVKGMVARSKDTTSSLKRFDKAVRAHHAKREAEQAGWTPERKADYARRLTGSDPPRSNRARPVSETLAEALDQLGATIAAKGG